MFCIKVSMYKMCMENIFFSCFVEIVGNNDVVDDANGFDYFIRPFSYFKGIYTSGYPGNQSQMLA